MFLFVGREQSWRGVIGAVRSVWTAIFPPNRNFRFYQIWHRHRTNWISIGLVRPAFGCFQFLRNQTDQRKRKSQFPFGFPHFLIIQTPSTKQSSKKKKKKGKEAYQRSSVLKQRDRERETAAWCRERETEAWHYDRKIEMGRKRMTRELRP